MGFMFPYSSAMRVLGGALLLSSILNALLYLRHVTLWDHPMYHEWYFACSWLFVFFGVVLVTASLWQDPRIVLVVSGVVAVLWYVYIVRGGW